MNQLVPIASPALPALVAAAAGERASMLFLESSHLGGPQFA
jgi:hypothetical protein